MHAYYSQLLCVLHVVVVVEYEGPVAVTNYRVVLDTLECVS